MIENRSSILEIAASHAYSIERQLSRSLSATYALAAMLKYYGEIKNFEEIADHIIINYGGISSLQLAPQGIVTQIHPLAGNEKAIGHNLLQDPARRIEALKTIVYRKLTLAGPFELIQGGKAVIGRLPVFIVDETNSDNFWGFTIVLIRLSKLLEATQIHTLIKKGYNYELSRIDPDSKHRLIFSHSGKDSLVSPVSFSFSVPNGEWTLSISPKNGWQHVAEFNFAIFIAGVVGLTFASIAFALLVRSDQIKAKSRALENEINERKRVENALQERERFLSAVFDSIQDGISVLDNDLNIIRVNQTMQDYYAHTLLLGGKRCYEAYQGRDKPCDVCPVLRALKSGKLEKNEVPFITGEGIPGILEVFAFPMLGDSGQPSGVVEYIRDITERKKIEEAMIESERMRGVLELAGAVCHEMNQPLMVISGVSDLILMTMSEDERFYKKISKISEQVHRLGKITRKLMSITQYKTKDYLENKIIDIEKSSNGKMIHEN
ncbi:MAG: CHASE domain-containing protein [Pseudomonadota bacterium]